MGDSPLEKILGNSQSIDQAVSETGVRLRADDVLFFFQLPQARLLGVKGTWKILTIS